MQRKFFSEEWHTGRCSVDSSDGDDDVRIVDVKNN